MVFTNEQRQTHTHARMHARACTESFKFVEFLIRLTHYKCKSLMFRSSPLLSVVYLSVPRHISKTKQSGSPSQNMTSDFAPEVTKYPKSSPIPKIVQNNM